MKQRLTLALPSDIIKSARAKKLNISEFLENELRKGRKYKQVSKPAKQKLTLYIDSTIIDDARENETKISQFLEYRLRRKFKR